MKIIISMSLFLSAGSLITMEKPITQNEKRRCSNCKESCVDVCKQVKEKHRSLILQLHTFHKAEAAKIYGNPCENIETEGIEHLFAEKVTPAVQPAPQKQVAKIFTATEVPVIVSPERLAQYTDIDTILLELEKDIPAPTKKVSLANHAVKLTDLIKRGSAEAAALLKEESAAAAYNLLDVTARALETKNNEFSDLFKIAAESEKSEAACIRLCLWLPQAINTTKKLAEKDPISNYLDDMSHPFNSYRNEIELLQHMLEHKK